MWEPRVAKVIGSFAVVLRMLMRHVLRILRRCCALHLLPVVPQVLPFSLRLPLPWPVSLSLADDPPVRAPPPLSMG